MDCTTTNASCYCPVVGVCEIDDYVITFNSLTKNHTHEGLHHREYFITVKATNNAGLHALKKIDILVDATPPTVGVVWEGLSENEKGDVDFTSSRTLHVRWHGFQDPESGVVLYRVTLSRQCFPQEDKEMTHNATYIRKGDMATLTFPHEGTYYVFVREMCLRL